MRRKAVRQGLPRAALAAALLGLLQGGCAGTQGEQASGDLWSRTTQTVSSAYEATTRTVTSTVQRLLKEQREGWMEMQEKEGAAAGQEAKGPPPPQEAPVPVDRFPADRSPIREAEIRRPQPAAAGGTPQDLLLLRRVPQAPEEIRRRLAEIDEARAQERDPNRRRLLAEERERLARVLQTSLEEESLIREMEQLRERLRRLQRRLLEIQGSRP